MSQLNRSQGIQSVNTIVPINSQRLVTEEVMRNELINLWNSQLNLEDDEKLLGVKDYEDRSYKIGEGCFFNDGNTIELYRAKNAVNGGAFNPSDWDKLTNQGVMSWNGRTGDVVPEDNDYNAAQIENTSNIEGDTVEDALNSLNAGGVSTANLTSFFTGETVEVNGIDYFRASLLGEGTVATASPSPVNVNDNQEAFFDKDLIGDPIIEDTVL